MEALNSSFDLRATVAPIARMQREQIGDFAIEWSNEIAADARYNRSTGADRTINVQEGTSHETFKLKTHVSDRAATAAPSHSTNAQVLDPCVPRDHSLVLSTASACVCVCSSLSSLTLAPPSAARYVY